MLLKRPSGACHFYCVCGIGTCFNNYELWICNETLFWLSCLIVNFYFWIVLRIIKSCCFLVVFGILLVGENSSGTCVWKKKIQSVLVDCQHGIGGTLRVKPLTWGHEPNFGSPEIWVMTVTHWIRPIMSYDIKLLGNHDFTKLLCCIVSQSWMNIEFVLKLVVSLTYRWYLKVIIYSLWIRSLLIEVDNNKYSQ